MKTLYYITYSAGKNATHYRVFDGSGYYAFSNMMDMEAWASKNHFILEAQPDPIPQKYTCHDCNHTTCGYWDGRKCGFTSFCSRKIAFGPTNVTTI